MDNYRALTVSRFKFTLLLLHLTVLVLLSSCTAKPDPEQLNLVLPGDPKSLDPAYATDVRTGQLCALLYDNLVRFGKGTEILPGLASHWEITADGLTYQFQLRTNVHFHDGSIFQAEDVIKSFERILNPETASHRSWLFRNVSGAQAFQQGLADSVTGFQILNDSLFTITLDQPFSPFLSFLAMPSASIAKPWGDTILGTGPWILDQWVHDGHILLNQFEDYYSGAAKLARIKIRILPEALPRIAEFITGYLDIMEIPEAEYDLWNKDPEWKDHIFHQNDLSTFYIGLNCSRPPFNDQRVRQALNHALNIPQIINEVGGGKGTPAAGPVPPQLLDHNVPVPYEYNPKKAVGLLNSAGYADGITVELWQSQSPELLLITEAIQAQLAAVGIQVNIIRNDWNMFTQAITQGIPDMYYRSWWADYPDPENFLAPLFQSDVSLARWTRYTNPDLDSLIEKLQREVDPAARLFLAVQANDILHQDAPWIYLWHSQTATIVNPLLSGWQPSVMFNAEKWLDVDKQPEQVNLR